MWAVRDGDWKLIHAQAGDEPPELFNLASAQPEKVKELKALWDAWNAQQAPPDAAKDKSLKREKRKAKKAAYLGLPHFAKCGISLPS